VVLSGLFIGVTVANMILFWLAQVTLIILIVRFRYLFTIIPVLMALIVAFIVYNWSVSIMYGYLALLPGFLMGYKARTFNTPRSIIVWGMIPYLIPIGLMIALYPRMIEQAPSLVAQMQAMLEITAKQFGISGSEMEKALVSARQIIEWILRLAPGIFFTMFLGLVLFAYLAATSMSAFFGAVLPKMSPMFLWKAGEIWLIPLGASLIFVLVGSHGLRTIGENSLFFLVHFYALFGLCMFDYYFRKANVSLPIRLIIYVILLVAVIVIIPVLAVLGLIDSRFDFRKVGIESQK
jgi:hypothetical protein